MAKRVKENNAWVRTFEVTDPTRHRKGFTVYKVTSTVFPRSFPESATRITVWKRYSDFRKLHKELEQIFKQLYLKGEFPVFPKAKVFGRFEYEVVEERRAAALVLLEFTATHTQLFTSKAFIQFFENGYKSEDFIGSILFSQDKNGDEPPTTARQERSDINVPCLEPEKLWNSKSKSTAEDDDLSLSLSSISSSLSPDHPEVTTPGHNGDSFTPSSTARGHETDFNGTPNTTTTTVTLPSPNLSGAKVDRNSSVKDSSTNNSQAPKSWTSALSSLTDAVDGVMHSSSEASTSRGKGIVRSATLTDDLSSYFEDEFEDAAFLFPSGSCASLDALPGFTPSSDDADSQSVNSKASSTSNRTGLFSLSRKKNGFGFFDFLPLFPKKSKKKQEKKREEERSKTNEVDKLSVGYICEAAGHFAVAQFHESNMEYQDAFAAYKEGIRVLLAGAQDDTDRDRKMLAKNKLEKYLSRAESLKDTYLSPGALDDCPGGISPVFSSPNKKEKCLSSLDRSGATSSHRMNGRSLLSSYEELRMFKVVARSPWKSNVLIVMNPDEETPKCYAAKVLWKSPCVIYTDKPTIIPSHIPFMTKLLKWFETSDKIILLLEYVGGGRLVDFVTNYQSKRISFVTPPDETGSPVEDPGPEDLVNQLTNEFSNAALDCKAAGTDVSEPKDLSNVLEDSEALAKTPILEVPVVTPTVIEPDVVERIAEEFVGSEESKEFNCPPGSIPPPVTPLLSDTNGDSYMNETEPDPEKMNDDLLEVRKLLENSKALLLNVTKTLEEGNSSSPRKLSKSLSHTNVDNSNDEFIGASKPSVLATTTTVLKTDEDTSHEHDLLVKKESTESNPTYSKDMTPEDSEESGIPKRMIPDGCIRDWAAEMILALESLHDLGITYGDLDINDILLGENGHISLRYKSLWKEIDDPLSSNIYMAPEVRYSIGVPLWKIHPSADWWSLGAILFWLFTGLTFSSVHPEGIFPEMIIKVPDTAINGSAISRSAQTLLSELLQFQPELRLGFYGSAEIKSHPFFEGFDWGKAIEEIQTGSGLSGDR